MIEALESAILAKDSAAVVKALAEWNESEREAARKPLAVFLLALNMDRHVLKALEVRLDENSPEIQAKRQHDGIAPMSRADSTYDYDLFYIAWLGCYGVATFDFCEQFPCVPDYEAEAARIMADRRPEWFDRWLEAVTPTGRNRDTQGLEAAFWARLYQHGLVNHINEKWLKQAFVQQLPEAMTTAREATEHVLRNVEAARKTLYDLSRWPHQLSNANSWVPVVQWMGQEGLLDHKAFLRKLAEALHQPLKQNERNGCVILAKAAAAPAAGCKVDALVQLQSHWIGLLSDQQAAVAGFGLDQLLTIEKAGRLSGDQVVHELASIFQHKPKTHAVKAIKMLERLAAEAATHDAALNGLCVALAHPNKDVQAAALDALARAIGPADQAIAETLRDHRDAVAATLKPQLSQLIDSLSAEEVATPAQPDEKLSSEFDLEDLRQRAASIPKQVAERFRVGEALRAADDHDLDLTIQWRMTDIRVLENREPLRPIESLSELVELTSQAVEHCECGDTPDRIVDAISRLHAERPEHFDVLTDSLRSRACAHIFKRPSRGIVGGILGNAFSDLIAAWLGVQPEDDDETFIPERYPTGDFLRKVFGRVRAGTAYSLLSTPTHQGGWIDPRVWVQRLRYVDRQQVDFLEEDLVRSLLRVAYDSREAAWQMANDSAEGLSERFRKLAQFVLDLNVPNEKLKLDASWPLPVWMTAIRARDPWVDLTDTISEAERAQVPRELWELPDVFQPSNYQWRALQPNTHPGRRGLVDYSPMPLAEADQLALEQQRKLAGQVLGDIPIEDIEAVLQSAATSQSHRPRDAGFYTAQLNFIYGYPAPAYVYPYLATHWPLKLTWYWALATSALSRRVESGSSVDERYDQYLLPLLESDRSIEPMAARALWIASTSKDPSAKAMATEVWIAVIADDRCDASLIVGAWLDVLAGGWMKMNRIGEVLAQVAAVSSQHALVVARLLEQFLSACEALPSDVAKLLEVLDECNEHLGRSVSESAAAALQTIRSGKAKTLAKSLLERKHQVTRQREEAIAAGLNSRLNRAERNSPPTPEAVRNRMEPDA